MLDSEISGLARPARLPKAGNHVARFSFAYHDIPATQPAFVPRPLDDDDLTFDPKTLAKKPPQSRIRNRPITASEDEPVETGFSLGD